MGARVARTRGKRERERKKGSEEREEEERKSGSARGFKKGTIRFLDLANGRDDPSDVQPFQSRINLRHRMLRRVDFRFSATHFSAN